jgi:hypothetical protein
MKITYRRLLEAKPVFDALAEMKVPGAKRPAAARNFLIYKAALEPWFKVQNDMQEEFKGKPQEQFMAAINEAVHAETDVEFVPMDAADFEAVDMNVHIMSVLLELFVKD